MFDVDQLAPPGSPEEALVRKLDPERLPRHVAIIMDGNGRWAKARRLPRVEGHRAGVEAVRDTVEAAAQLGLSVLTLYAFSVENWKRPRFEVWTLMNLLKEYIRRELQLLVKNDIQLRVIGRMADLEPSVQEELQKALDATARGSRMVFNIALNYSGRCEIVDACKQIAADWAALPPQDRFAIDEERVTQALYTRGLPDPDLLVRTSGELRISNFLLWQIAYSEIWVTPTLWPDFRRRDLFEALVAYQGRERRYGGVVEEEVLTPGRER
jgi:undecaprenyl diphosphate synthase